MKSNNKYLSIALIISIIAALVIEVILFTIIISSDIMVIFMYPYVLLMILLLIMGIISNYAYLKSTNHAKWFLKNITPTSLILAGLVIIIGYMGNFIGALLIFIAYIFEILTGMKLKDDLREISREWSLVFITGVSIFVLSMPLLLYSTYLALIPMIGDAIKTVGIYFLYKKLE
jgi:hypothetical protein